MGKTGNSRLGILLAALALFSGCQKGGDSSGTQISDASVSLVYPENDSHDIALETVIEAQFSKPMDASSITVFSFIAIGKNAQIAGIVDYDTDSQKARLTPTAPLDSNTIYEVTLNSGVHDAEGRALKPYSWSFKTKDILAPFVIETIPLNDVHFVTPESSIQAIFSENMDASSLTTNSFIVSANGSNIEGTIQYLEGEKKAVFTPSAPLATFTEFTATLTTAVQDSAGIPIALNYVWKFKTLFPQTVQVNSTTPGNGAQDVDIFDVENNHPIFIEAHFSAPLDPQTVNASTFIVTDGLNTQIEGLIEYFDSQEDHFARFTPINGYSILALDQTYYVTLTGMTDLYENPVEGNAGGNYVWSFKTREGVGVPQMLSDCINVAQPQVIFNPVLNVFQAVWQEWNSQTSATILYSTSFTSYPDLNAKVKVSGSNESNASNLMSPKLTLGPNGELYVVWQQFLPGEFKNSIFFNENTGNGWGTPVLLDNDLSKAYYPQIAVNGSGPCVVWEQDPTGSHKSIFFTQRTAGVWSAPVTIEVPTTLPGQGNAGHAKDARIVVDSTGNTIVTFTQTGVTYWTWNGVQWNGQTTTFYSLIATDVATGLGNLWYLLNWLPASDAMNPVLKSDNAGNTVVMYQQAGAITGFPIQYDIMMNYHSGTLNWGPTSIPVEQASGNLSNTYPSFAFDNSGYFYATWTQEFGFSDPSGNILFKAVSPMGPVGPAVPIDIDGVDTALSATGHSQIAIANDGTFHVTFLQKEAKSGPSWNWNVRIYLTKSTPTGGWTTPSALDFSSDSNPDLITSMSENRGIGQIAFSNNFGPVYIFEQALPTNYGYRVLVNTQE